MVAAMATFGKVPMNCQVCTMPGNADLRRQWGCDGPQDVPRITIECARCGGRSHDCTRCEGSGTETFDRCPWATMLPEIERVLDYSNLMEAGILPVAGGWADQSHTFVRAVKIVNYVREKLAQKPPGSGAGVGSGAGADGRV